MAKPGKSRFRFLVDEDLHTDIARFLKREGHDVAHVPKGFKNGTVFRMAVKSRRVLLSGDSDFTQSSLFPPLKTKGIAVVRIHPQKPSLILPILKMLLALSPNRLKGKLVLLEPDGIRIL